MNPNREVVPMVNIEKRYIVDERNRKVGVQIDIDTFRRLEEVIENYALAKLMEEDENSDRLGIDKVKEYYQRIRN